MSSTRHDSIIVTGLDCSVVYAEAQRIGMILSPLVEAHSNGFVSFCVFPDGANEKWTSSNIFDSKRKELIKVLKNNPDVDWVQVSFGGDGGKAQITNEAY